MSKYQFSLTFIFLLLMHSVYSIAQSTERDSDFTPTKVKRTGALDGGPFYLVSNGMLIINFEQLNDTTGDKLYEYRRWLHPKSDEVWKKIETKKLEALGFKEGMKFQIVEWKNKTKSEYTLKKYINLAMIQNDFYEEGAPYSYFRTFYVVLSDNIEGREHPGTPNDDEVTGISYTGNEYILKASSETDAKNLISRSADLDKETEDAMKYFIKNSSSKVPTKQVSVMDLSFEKTKLYFLQTPQDQKLLLKKPSGDYETPKIKFGHYNSINDSRFSNFIEGAELTILQGSETMHTCYELFIFQGKEMKGFKLMCDSGGC